MQMTGGIGPDAVIDAVGLEAHGLFADNILDHDQGGDVSWAPIAPIRSARRSSPVRKGGRVSMPAVYGGFVDKFPLGAFMEKGLTLKTGQTHVQHYMPGAAQRDHGGQDRHHLPDLAPPGSRGARRRATEMFNEQPQRGDTKVVLKPGSGL